MSTNWNITKTEMSPKLKCYQNRNVIELKCHKNWNVTKNEMSPKLKCLQNWNVTKTEMSSKLKFYLNWNVTISKNVIKIQIQIELQDIGTDHLGLVCFISGQFISSFHWQQEAGTPTHMEQCFIGAIPTSKNMREGS